MNAKPWAERVYIVVGVVVWLIVSVAVTVGVMTSPGDHTAAAVFMVLSWIALVAFLAMARFLGRIGGFN